MAFDWVELLRVLHILTAILWVGGAVFALIFIGPAVRAAGKSGQEFMAVVGRRGGPARVMGPISGITILTGILLYWQRGYYHHPFATGPVAALSLGALLGLVVFILGMGIGLPIQRRMARMAKGFGPTGPTSDQQATMARMGARAQALGKNVTWLLVATVVLMVGRNLLA
jgi:uncharacterized membrane protein